MNTSTGSLSLGNWYSTSSLTMAVLLSTLVAHMRKACGSFSLSAPRADQIL